MKPSQVAARLTMWAVGAVEVMLGLRFVLRLVSADASNDFVAWVYENTAGVLQPFFDWVPARTSGGIDVELSTLIAMATYAVLAFVFMAVVGNWRTKADGVAPATNFSVSFRDRK